MRRFTLPAVFVSAAVALLALLTYGLSQQGTNHSIDNQVARHQYPLAPSAATALPVLDSSRTESLAQLRGRVVLVNMFSSWCGPCQQEAPVLDAAQRLLAAHGGTVIGISYQDNSSDDASFVRQYHIDFPILRDVSGSFAHSFGTSGVPESFVIGRDGRILALRRYQLSLQWVRQTLPPILAQRS